MPDEHTRILPYGRQYVDEVDIKRVSEILASPFLTTGPVAEDFEAELCRITGAAYAVVCSSGTAALHLACLALGVSEGDIGLTSPLSFLASANCIEYCSGRADFIDIDPETLCLSPEKLEAYCIRKGGPKVVIPVDYAGGAAALPRIRALSDRFGFKVIEDAAHALGSRYPYGGEVFSCGSCAHSDLAVFSFHPVKNITTGEGGAVMTNDGDLAQKLRKLRNHGAEKSREMMDTMGAWYYEMDTLGLNYRITDIQCAMGLSQLEKLGKFRARRRMIVSMYNRAFKGNTNLKLPPKCLESLACPHLYPIQFMHPPHVRRSVYEQLKADHINCQVHYIPIYWQPYYADRYGYAKGKCPNAEAYYSRCLSLPLFPAMSDADVETVVAAVFKALSGLGFD